MAEINLKIEGMSCQHCVMSVKNAIEGIEGVASSDVSVGAAAIKFDDSKTDENTIAAAVQNAGYRVNN